jgi:hypothetical protein
MFFSAWSSDWRGVGVQFGVKYFSDLCISYWRSILKERKSEKMETMGVWILSILSLIPVWEVEVIGDAPPAP